MSKEKLQVRRIESLSELIDEDQESKVLWAKGRQGNGFAANLNICNLFQSSTFEITKEIEGKEWYCGKTTPLED